MASTINATLYTALNTLGYTVREQGSFGATETLPTTFITYQVIAVGDINHFDNAPNLYTTRVQVALYSTDPAITQAADATLWTPLKAAGFMRLSGGRQLPFDAASGHYGYTRDYRLLEREA